MIVLKAFNIIGKNLFETWRWRKKNSITDGLCVFFPLNSSVVHTWFTNLFGSIVPEKTIIRHSGDEFAYSWATKEYDHSCCWKQSFDQSTWIMKQLILAPNFDISVDIFRSFTMLMEFLWLIFETSKRLLVWFFWFSLLILQNYPPIL